MKRFNQLVQMESYKNELRQIKEFEKNRIYCKHEETHFRDVARIAYILSLEEDLHIEKELIYVTAYLHDMGRAYEYRKICSHESGGVLLGANLLPECGFSEEEIKMILDAIATHRKNEDILEGTLGSILYRADKLSRDCFCCNARETCKWTEAEKNHTIQY